MVLIPKCKTSLNNKEYTPTDLEKIKTINGKHNDILDNLICISCGVKLCFRSGSTKRKPYISVWPKNEHAENCTLVTTVKINGSYRSSKVETIELSTKDKLNKVKHLVTVLNDKPKMNSKSKSTNKKSKKIEPSGKKSGNSIVSIGTNNPNADTTSNEKNRSPRINNIPAQKLTPNMIGTTKIIFGTLDKVNIKNDNATLTLTYNGYRLELHSSAAFFKEPTDTRLKSFKTLKSIVENDNKKPQIEVFCFIQQSNNGNIEAVFYKLSDIYFGKQTFILYITNNQ